MDKDCANLHFEFLAVLDPHLWFIVLRLHPGIDEWSGQDIDYGDSWTEWVLSPRLHLLA
jgi:hypothetical protein